MQISGISNNQYGRITTETTQQQSTSAASPQNNQDTVTLSPEAMKEFKKLAMYAGKAGDYLPKVNVLNNPDSHKIGYAAWEMNFRETYRAELDEYGDKFNAYYEETKAEFDIVTADDHYEKVVSVEGFNPAFQQTFEDKLRDDPRMLSLMNILGIKPPV